MAYNKSDLITKMAQESGLTKTDCEKALNAFESVLIDSLKTGEGLKLTGVFSAERILRTERTGRNPRTNEVIHIPARYGVKLSAGSLLKKAVAKD